MHFYTTLATVKDFWWDVTFVPRGPDGTQASTSTNNHVSALRGTRHPDAAWKLLYFMAAGEGAKLRSDIQSIPPGHKRTFDDAWMKATPAVRRQVLKETHPWARGLWKGRGVQGWNQEVNVALQKAYNGTASLTAAMQEATDKGTQAIQTARRA